jgi:RNase H-fold protein (predicted Holliday junction resolvase)
LPEPDKIGVKKFAEKFSLVTKIEPEFFDETLTTHKVTEESKGKGKKEKVKEDSLAAVKILEGYLQTNNG